MEGGREGGKERKAGWKEGIRTEGVSGGDGGRNKTLCSQRQWVWPPGGPADRG